MYLVGFCSVGKKGVNFCLVILITIAMRFMSSEVKKVSKDQKVSKEVEHYSFQQDGKTYESKYTRCSVALSLRDM